MSFQKNQAIHQQRLRVKRRSVNRRLLVIAFLIALLALLLWGWHALKNPKVLPIERVQLRGELSHLNQNRLKKLLLPLVKTNFFQVNIAAIQRQLLTLPWIKQVDVSRLWPHGLLIIIKEQHPVVQWDGSGLLNRQGQLFNPKSNTIPKNLPLLWGPKGQAQIAFTDYQQLNKPLNVLGLTIRRMQLSARQSISLTLSDGVELLLGKQDIMSRLHRFIAVYPKIFSGKDLRGVRVDMRYTNGMAVKW